MQRPHSHEVAEKLKMVENFQNFRGNLSLIDSGSYFFYCDVIELIARLTTRAPTSLFSLGNKCKGGVRGVI